MKGLAGEKTFGSVFQHSFLQVDINWCGVADKCKTFHSRKNKLVQHGHCLWISCGPESDLWQHDGGKAGGGRSREESGKGNVGYWECRHGKSEKPEVVVWEGRVEFGHECVYGTKVTVCMHNAKLSLCLLIAWSCVQLSHPHTPVWILLSRLDFKSARMCVYVYWFLCVSRVTSCHWIPE